MDRFHQQSWLLAGVLVLVVGCKPEATTETQSKSSPQEEIEMPAELSDAPRSNEVRVREPNLLPMTVDSARQRDEIRLAPQSGLSASDKIAGRDPSAPSYSLRRSTAMPEDRASEETVTENLAIQDRNSVTEDSDATFHAVDVLYATDRKQAGVSLTESQLSDQRQLVSLLGMGSAVALVFCLIAWLARRSSTAKLSGAMAMIMALGAGGIFLTASGDIDKSGVTYSGGRGELVRGVCRVTVPVSHRRGTVERPSVLKFEVTEDQSKHIVLTDVSPLPVDAFEERLEQELRAARQPDLMVFIHGYNVHFESAVLRTAQIAVDLPFDGVPICYSWPSQGTLLGYPVDENNAAWTVGHLKQFLGELVDRSGAKSIHVVAHSMGNRAMTSALQQMVYQRGGEEVLFDRVVLAAPDVDADLFRKDLAPSLTQIARQVTLYASSDDQALVASKKVHGYPRAGETGKQLVIVPGVETIDVSGIDLSLLGHSYYGESEPMLRDLYDVLLSRLPASQRPSLVSQLFRSQVYWRLADAKRIASGDPRTRETN